MAYENELIGSTLLTRLQDNLGDKLDDVETAWDGRGDAVTLPDPATWFEGHKPTVLEMESSEFPFVSVIVPDRTPEAAPMRWGYQEQVITLYVDYFVVADDEAMVNKRCHRYAEAIVEVLKMEHDIEGYGQLDYEPRVRLSEASRHAKTTDADMLEVSDVDFIQMGRVELSLEGG